MVPRDPVLVDFLSLSGCGGSLFLGCPNLLSASGPLAQAVAAFRKALPLPLRLTGFFGLVWSQFECFLGNRVLWFSLDYCLILSLICACPSFNVCNHLFDCLVTSAPFRE